MDNGNQKVKRPPKQAFLVAHQILSDIDTAELKPGDRLQSEQAMLERYGVARGTLREALRILETLGVIALKPGPKGGPVLLGPWFEAVAVGLSLTLFRSGTSLQEVVDARVAIEPVCARLAAEHATAEQIADLHRSLAIQEQLIDDETAFLAENVRFHELIAQAGSNSPLLAFIRSLSAIEDGQAVGVRYERDTRLAVLEMHRSIVTAIAAGDGDAVTELMEAHMREFDRYLARQYPELARSKVQWRWP